MRRLVQRALQRAGYRVATARDGEEALEILESCEIPIDLVLTDVVMPRMNGRELAARLSVARPDLEVLFMSGYAGHPVSDSLLLEPASSLLQKPFTLDQLCRTVRECLDTRARRADRKTESPPSRPGPVSVRTYRRSAP
jgi:DNA-binding NtrC family response regulator